MNAAASVNVFCASNSRNCISLFCPDLVSSCATQRKPAPALSTIGHSGKLGTIRWAEKKQEPTFAQSAAKGGRESRMTDAAICTNVRT